VPFGRAEEVHLFLSEVKKMTVRRGRTAATGFMRDFQQFLLQGNVVELATAVIIGGAFGKIVTSLTDDIITPALLSPLMKAAGVDELAKLQTNGIKYGQFLATVLNFILVAFVIFLLIRALAKFKRQEEVAAEAAPPDPILVSQERLTGAIDRLTTTMETR
jgi:large conductance mechanosensitive channel